MQNNYASVIIRHKTILSLEEIIQSVRVGFKGLNASG